MAGVNLRKVALSSSIAIVLLGSGFGSSALSAKTQTASPPNAPSVTQVPVLSGTDTADSTLKVSSGTWNGAQKFSYVWQECSTSCHVAKATSATSYVLTAADVGSKIRVAVEGSNEVGATTSYTSNSSRIQEAPKPPAEETKTTPPAEETKTTGCFASPGACAYPDPNYHNVGATCSALKTSGSVTASTEGSTVEGLNITGTVTVRANNVKINNDCIATNGGAELGSRSITIEKGVHGVSITNTTVHGENESNKSEDSAIVNDYAGSANSAVNDYFYNCGECIHGPWTVNQSYVIVNGMRGTSDHYEDWYFSDDTISANHDTLLNTYDQTAVIFGDTSGPADNHITVTNSLIAGGGFTFYPDGNASSKGSETTNISNNRIARCLTSPKFESGTGGTSCSGGQDSHGYWPNGGYFGLIAYGFGGTYANNVWDDNNAPVELE
jgi:hypothetical protein